MDLYLMADGGMARLTRVAAPARNPAREETLRWFDELRDPLRRYLMCSGADPADADEAVQESFLRFCRYLEANGQVENARAWLYQVARNFLRDDRKSARRQRTVPIDDAMGNTGHFADRGGNPEQSLLRGEQARLLRAAVERLPRYQRECILLRSSGLRYREIAEVMGININTVGSLVQRAMSRLSEDLT
jgi:RNA polymerase sigma-70 factor (ECF subfamily)